MPSSALSARRASILRRSSTRSGNSSAYSSSRRLRTSIRRKRGSSATCGADEAGGGSVSERASASEWTVAGRSRRSLISFFQIDCSAGMSDLCEPQLAGERGRAGKEATATLDQPHQLGAPARARDGGLERDRAVGDERSQRLLQ